jgi:hypothetical protein
MNRLLGPLKITMPVLMLALSACGAQQSKPVVEFPDREVLAAIGQSPAAKPKIPDAAAPGGGWKVEQTLPSMAGDEPWQPEGVWEKAFAEAATSAPRPPRITRALSCAAREIGSFFLKNRAMLGEGLRRFMLGVCGGIVTELSVAYLSVEVPPDATEEQMFAKLGPDLKSKAKDALRSSPALSGFWFGRQEKQAVAVTVLGAQKAQIKPFSLVPNTGGEVIIEGRLNEPAQYFIGYINQGRAGVEHCDLDVSVPRPSFRAVCRPAAEDQSAWIQLFYAPPKRVLTVPFAQVLVRRTAEEVPVYEEMAYAEPRPVKTPNEFTRVALEQLNRARSEAGLRKVTLTPQQSATATQLAPHYFAAALGGTEPEKVDTIALGMLAGWEVPGMIREASFVSDLVPHTLDAGRWLSSALEMPMGRMTLFSPDIEQVAFGPFLMTGPDALGALVGGYRFHHGDDHTDDVKMLLTRVVRARRRLGLPAPLRLGTMAEVMKEELAHVHAGKAQPMEAMEAVLERGVGKFHASMRGLVIEAASLDELELPAQVARQSTLHLDIGVTHYKAPGAAWAQFTILVIWVDFTGSEA